MGLRLLAVHVGLELRHGDLEGRVDLAEGRVGHRDERGSARGFLQGGEFAVASYEDIAAGRVAWQADTVSCNFALIGEERARKRLSGEPA